MVIRRGVPKLLILLGGMLIGAVLFHGLRQGKQRRAHNDILATGEGVFFDLLRMTPEQREEHRQREREQDAERQRQHERRLAGIRLAGELAWKYTRGLRRLSDPNNKEDE